MKQAGLYLHGRTLRGRWNVSTARLHRAHLAGLNVEYPTRFELVVNMKTAKTLGITIPGKIMLQANRVIE